MVNWKKEQFRGPIIYNSTKQEVKICAFPSVLMQIYTVLLGNKQQ